MKDPFYIHNTYVNNTYILYTKNQLIKWLGGGGGVFNPSICYLQETCQKYKMQKG